MPTKQKNGRLFVGKATIKNGTLVISMPKDVLSSFNKGKLCWVIRSGVLNVFSNGPRPQIPPLVLNDTTFIKRPRVKNEN